MSKRLGVVICTYKLSTGEAKADRSWGSLSSQPTPNCEHQANKRPCFKNKVNSTQGMTFGQYRGVWTVRGRGRDKERERRGKKERGRSSPLPDQL